jgi:hypothetical protein
MANKPDQLRSFIRPRMFCRKVVLRASWTFKRNLGVTLRDFMFREIITMSSLHLARRLATHPVFPSAQNANQPEFPRYPRNSDWFRLSSVPLGRLGYHPRTGAALINKNMIRNWIMFAVPLGRLGYHPRMGAALFNKNMTRNWIMFAVPLGRLELPFLAPEANALSTELQGRASRFYHEKIGIR